MAKRLSDRGNDHDDLDGGLAEAFGPTSAPRDSVLVKLSEAIGSAPRVSLRDTDPASGPEPIVQPGSSEMPAPADRAAGSSSSARSPAAAWGPCSRAATPTWAATWPSRCCSSRHRDHPELVRRFIEEAQIGGQLQHPGVVPVYELGSSPTAGPTSP